MGALRWRALVPPIGIASLTAALFLPSLRFGFLWWDDIQNLNEIPGFAGRASSGVTWIFTTSVMGHWVPATWATFALDHALWGADPAGYHATNVALHVLNSVLCYAVARRLLQASGPLPAGAITAGALVAALAFAIHPLRVESVAWITERRDVLSGTGFFLTLLTYLRAVDRPTPPRRAWLAASVVCYAAGMLAKQVLITLPVVLVLIDLYPLRRRVDAAVLREKAPFAIVSLAGIAALALHMHQDLGLTPMARFTPAERLAVFAYGAMFYPVQTLAPFDLSPMHEMPARHSLLAPVFLASVLATLAVTGLALALRRRAPALLAVWTYGVVTMLPLSGVVHAEGTNLVADRYSYLITLGWTTLAGGLFAQILARQQWREVALAVTATAALLGSWMTLTRWELDHWRDTEALWSAAVAKQPDCGICHGLLAIELLNHGRLVEAEHAAARAVALRPDRAMPHVVLGDLLHRRGRYVEAVHELQAAAAVAPNERLVREVADVLRRVAAEHTRAGRHGDAERARSALTKLTTRLAP